MTNSVNPTKVVTGIARLSYANIWQAKSINGGVPKYSSALADMVAQPRSATVMGLLEEARQARLRGFKVAQKSGSMKTAFGRFKDFIVGNF